MHQALSIGPIHSRQQAQKKFHPPLHQYQADLSLPSTVTVSLSVPSMIYVGEGDDKVQVCASALMPPGVSERKAIVTLTTSDDTGS